LYHKSQVARLPDFGKSKVSAAQPEMKNIPITITMINAIA